MTGTTQRTGPAAATIFNNNSAVVLLHPKQAAAPLQLCDPHWQFWEDGVCVHWWNWIFPHTLDFILSNMLGINSQRQDNWVKAYIQGFRNCPLEDCTNLNPTESMWEKKKGSNLKKGKWLRRKIGSVNVYLEYM